MAVDQAIYLSTAGILLGYAVETVAGTKPETFTELQGATSLSEISSEKEQIEVTPLSATKYKEYVGGLADPGGTWEIGFNESNFLHSEWSKLRTAYEAGMASNKRTWFQVWIPNFEEAFYIIGEPNILGFGGAEVSSAFANTARVTINKVEGWDNPVKPTAAGGA